MGLDRRVHRESIRCSACGNEFVAKVSHGRSYCSHDCADNGSREKGLEARTMSNAIRRGHRVRLSEEEVMEIYGSELPIVEIAESYGVRWHRVWSIKHGKTWSSLTGAEPYNS